MKIAKLTTPKRGRPPEKQGDGKELQSCIEFFKMRSIGPCQVCRAIDVSQTLAYRWWKTGEITQANLDKLQELVKAIKAQELINNGKLFNS
jgi:NADH:ubiquinone oxidoreductase subunit F (NADH-binding)